RILLADPGRFDRHYDQAEDSKGRDEINNVVVHFLYILVSSPGRAGRIRTSLNTKINNYRIMGAFNQLGTEHTEGAEKQISFSGLSVHCVSKISVWNYSRSVRPRVRR